MGVEEPTFPHTPHTTTQPHKRREVSPHISHNHKKPKLTVERPTEEELTLHHTERKLTLQLQPTEVKLTEDVLTPHHTERKLTPQLQLMEVKPTVETLTEVKLTEEEPTGVNNTVTRRGTQIDCFAELFENHQIPTKKLKIDNCVFIF